MTTQKKINFDRLFEKMIEKAVTTAKDNGAKPHPRVKKYTMADIARLDRKVNKPTNKRIIDKWN